MGDLVGVRRDELRSTLTSIARRTGGVAPMRILVVEAGNMRWRAFFSSKTRPLTGSRRIQHGAKTAVCTGAVETGRECAAACSQSVMESVMRQ